MGNIESVIQNCSCSNNPEEEKNFDAQQIIAQQWNPLEKNNGLIPPEKMTINNKEDQNKFSKDKKKNADGQYEYNNMKYIQMQSKQSQQQQYQTQKKQIKEKNQKQKYSQQYQSRKISDEEQKNLNEEIHNVKSNARENGRNNSLTRNSYNKYQMSQSKNQNFNSTFNNKDKSNGKEEENEIILKEGELLKIQPGVQKQAKLKNGGKNNNFQFVSKWCQLTENKFRYYKSKIQAYQNPDKPLFSIYLRDIAMIEKKNINKEEVSFEIMIEKQFSTFARESRKIEKMFETSPFKDNNIDNQSSFYNVSPEREIKAGHLVRAPIGQQQQKGYYNENEYREGGGTSSKFQTSQLENNKVNDKNKKNNWSKREEDWYEIEEKLLFKNNVQNASEGDKSNTEEWYKAILNQQREVEQKAMSIQSRFQSHQFTFAETSKESNAI